MLAHNWGTRASCGRSMASFETKRNVRLPGYHPLCVIRCKGNDPEQLNLQSGSPRLSGVLAVNPPGVPTSLQALRCSRPSASSAMLPAAGVAPRAFGPHCGAPARSARAGLGSAGSEADRGVAELDWLSQDFHLENTIALSGRSLPPFILPNHVPGYPPFVHLPSALLTKIMNQ